MNTDLISRADAEALFRTARSKLNPSDYKTADEFNTRDLMLLNAEQMIHLLPPVTPKQKTRYWISHENDGNKSRIGEIGDCIAIAIDEPSVTPMQRTGHWIKNGETDENGNAEYMCSECTHGDVHAETQIVPFCWWCGTRMVEPQESGDDK